MSWSLQFRKKKSKTHRLLRRAIDTEEATPIHPPATNLHGITDASSGSSSSQMPFAFKSDNAVLSFVMGVGRTAESHNGGRLKWSLPLRENEEKLQCPTMAEPSLPSMHDNGHVSQVQGSSTANSANLQIGPDIGVSPS